MATDSQRADDSEKPPPEPISPAIAGLAAWALPGLGYWLIGERARAVTVGVAVIALFVMGLLIGGVRVIEVPTYDHAGQKMPNASLAAEIRSKPWSIAQIMTGPVGIVAGYLSIAEASVGSDSHARVNEIAVLYTAVAGMLNLLVIIDTAHRAGQMQEGS